MTEEEAQTKWCPFARVVRASETGMVAADQAAMNRFDVPDRTKSPQTPLASNCIASQCMAWRPTTALHAFNRDTGADLGPRPAINVTREDFGRVSTGGYCGLSGAPQ